MEERGIIIADRDEEYRKEMAEFFEKAGYSVETTDSAVRVLCCILQKQTPVLLLGSDFDKKVSAAELIHLLKKCNRRLHVIMVSDQMPLAQLRQVRQEGIFYHALKPSEPGDTEEIGSAVASAFQSDLARAERRVVPESAYEAVPETAGAALSKGTPFLKAVAWLTGMAALIFGISYLSLLAAQRAEAGSSAAIWIFLGFCALIVVSQFLPIFDIRLPQRARRGQQSKQQPDRSLEDR
jgi:FixJ family two-component response regulator